MSLLVFIKTSSRERITSKIADRHLHLPSNAAPAEFERLI